MNAAKTPEEQASAKRVHALVMMVLGAIMAACALAAGLIALHPGAFPSWMIGAGRRRPRPAFRRPAAPRVAFAAWSPALLERARRERKLVLLDLTVFWSRDAREMEETTYADPAVAAWAARRAVAARADAEETPALARRYGVGAWPATLLLLPDGRPVAAGAYLTPALFLPWARLIDERLGSRPGDADALARRTEEMLAQARAARAEHADAAWAAAAARREDPVWGGVYGGRGAASTGGGGYEKLLDDQARFVAAAADRAAARRALGFVARFLALPGGGYAASVRGEAEAPDGRIAEGFYYFARDDAGRRALGLPARDVRLRPDACRRMARAVLSAPESTPEQRAHARLTLERLVHLI